MAEVMTETRAIDPTILALGEMNGTNGKDAITAYIAGFETEVRIGRGVNFVHYEKGWHPTATLGIFGTVACNNRIQCCFI